MKLTLIDKKTEAEATKTFIFKPEHAFDFLPGQYLYYTLPKLIFPDPRGETRQFTISSSPTERDFVMLTTRIRNSGFKKTLDSLKIGDAVDAEGPNGSFVFEEKFYTSPNVFIAGGIGITPFRSMLEYVYDKKIDSQILLIYSNSTPEQIAFRNELERFSKQLKNFKLQMTITQPENSKETWNGPTGRIDKNLLTKLNASRHTLSANFWLCGPPAMVDSIEEILLGMGVNTKNIQLDKFTGY
jgi:ferredoxin-NADP reductase